MNERELIRIGGIFLKSIVWQNAKTIDFQHLKENRSIPWD